MLMQEKSDKKGSVKLLKMVRDAAKLRKVDMARRYGVSRQVYDQMEDRNKSLTEPELATTREIFPGTDAEFCHLIKLAGKKALKEKKERDEQ